MSETKCTAARRCRNTSPVPDDRAERINTHAQGTQVKFEALASDLYSFFRGTALLFYRDIAGRGAARPKDLLLGNVHPCNFGIKPNADNIPIFSVNDFDEVTYGPYSWDIKTLAKRNGIEPGGHSASCASRTWRYAMGPAAPRWVWCAIT
jgi:hypothetical protein